MTQFSRRIDLGPLQVAGMQVVYENNHVKSYASYRSFVPENILFLLCIEFLQPSKDKLIALFGDKIGEFVFLGAVSHTADRIGGLPTGILCMSVNAFNAWLLPIDPEHSKIPEIGDFCLCRADEFLADSNTADQTILLNNDVFKPALKTFIRFMVELKLSIGRSSFDETFLGYKDAEVAAGIATPADSNAISTPENVNRASTPANNNAKTDLTEDEKLALQIGAEGIRKSARHANQAKISYGPSGRIPAGALNLPPLPINKNKNSAANDKNAKNNAENKKPPPVLLQTGTSTPKTTAATGTSKEPVSRLTKSQLVEELNNLKKAAASKSTPVEVAPMSSLKLTQTPINPFQLGIKKTEEKGLPNFPAKDDIASRIDYRAQGKLDFEQAETYAKSFYSFGKTMLTDFREFHSPPNEQ